MVIDEGETRRDGQATGSERRHSGVAYPRGLRVGACSFPAKLVTLVGRNSGWFSDDKRSTGTKNLVHQTRRKLSLQHLRPVPHRGVGSQGSSRSVR